MKHFKKIISVLLASLLIIGVLPFSVFANDQNTPKEEVVYINLNSDGSVNEINVVNIFELDEKGQIIDYGKYESLRNMTTTDKIDYSGDTVKINAKAGKLYYEGKLSSKAMPWNISIRYFLDDKEYNADEIAGKSGNLKIKMNITDNTECIGNFFEGYALQVSFTLDTERCSNIIADGATVANVGSDKQLTYTVFPNKGADIEIKADVKDFEMSGIAINGVKLNLDIAIDETEIQNKIDEIIGAINDLDKGATELKNGAEDAYNGTFILNGKSGELYDGVEKLNEGAAELSGGMTAITAKNKQLLDGAYSAFMGLCTASQTILNAQLAENGIQTVSLTPENYDAVLTQLLKTIDADEVYNTAYNIALTEVTAQVESSAEDLYAGYIEQNADAIYLAYIQSQADTLYAQVAAKAVLEKLITDGYTPEQAEGYLQTAEGQYLIAQSLNAMTDEQKQQIIETAVANLTPEEKTQIKAAALQSMTDEQKSQIKSGYIEQMMLSEEVTAQITAAVAAANSAAAGIVELKGQLDNYKLFYEGLKEYTNAVSDAAKGADALKINMDTLCKNVGVLKTSVCELNDGVKKLFDGTAELKDGTGKFVKQTSNIDSEISNEIDSIISSASGADVEITSFVSNNNTNVQSVQFVIKTNDIKIEKTVDAAPNAEEKLNFWQKLLRLFGLY